jgi:hypothetical protein
MRAGVDAESNVVRKLPVRIAGTGRKGNAGVGGAALKVKLARPHGVFADRQGTL